MTENATIDKSAEKAAAEAAETAAREARMTELKTKLASGLAQAGGDVSWLSSPEGQAIIDEIQKLGTKAKKAKAETDPKLAEEKKAINVFLFGTESDKASGQQAKLASKLNTVFAEKFPLLKEKGASIEVILKVKGAGKGTKASGSASDGKKYARILHRTADGKRNQIINHQGLVSLNKLAEVYPDDIEKIREIFGTGEKRNALWNESKNAEGVGDTKKIYLTLSDGSTLCLQS